MIVQQRVSPPVLQTVSASRPSLIERAFIALCLIVQQGAFISLPLTMAGESTRGIDNPYNTVGVAVSLAFVGLMTVRRFRRIMVVAIENPFSVMFLVIVLLSGLWSVHPGISVRRGVGYVVTMLIAAYMADRFDETERMKLLSLGFAVPAIGSALLIAVFPEYGIMQTADLAGTWRGVFPHKNVFGPTAAAAVFTELYVLVAGRGRPRWRFVLLALYLALVIGSESSTGSVLSLFYLGGAALYALWRRRPLAAAVAAIAGGIVLAMAGLIVAGDLGSVLGMFGKDSTLTGRTTLWGIVTGFISERPWLGWGYRAMWQPSDASTVFADAVTGHWGVTSSHNAFLEITLQLGFVGLGMLLLIIATSVWRGVRCCLTGNPMLGWFSVLYFLGAIASANTLETLGQNQVIEWVLFNVLAFSCGLTLYGFERHRDPAGVADTTGGWRRQHGERNLRPSLGQPGHNS